MKLDFNQLDYTIDPGDVPRSIVQNLFALEFEHGVKIVRFYPTVYMAKLINGDGEVFCHSVLGSSSSSQHNYSVKDLNSLFTVKYGRGLGFVTTAEEACDFVRDAALTGWRQDPTL